MEKKSIFDYLEKSLMWVCLSGGAVCLVAGFFKPHCLFMAAMYLIPAWMLHECIKKREENKKLCDRP